MDLSGANFGELMGFETISASAERVVGRVHIDERHHQPYGVVHGGVYCAIVEHLASHGAAEAARERGIAGVLGASNSTDFFRAHSHGPLDAVAEPVHVGRTQQVWEVRITRPTDGKLVARGQVRLAHIDHLPADRS